MSLLVNTDGHICIACSAYFEGTPSCMHFNPDRQVLSLEFEDGREEPLGTAGQGEIRRLLHKAQTVQFLQLRESGYPCRVKLPLHIRLETQTAQAASM